MNKIQPIILILIEVFLGILLFILIWSLILLLPVGVFLIDKGIIK